MISQDDKNKSDNIRQNHSDFSIDHILNRAGSSTSNVNFNMCENFEKNSPLHLDPYSWLHCSRYCPPKIPRAQKKDGPQKRQLGRHPRIPFTSHQLSVLEEKFQQSPYLSSEEVIALSRRLQLADVRVKIWFQNRRARERREKMVQNSESESQEDHKKNSLPNSQDISSSSTVQPVSETNIYNFFPPHTLVQNHLSNYFVPIKNCTLNEQEFSLNIGTR